MTLVFSKGEWVDVIIPAGQEHVWSDSDKFHYAMVYCFVKNEKGLSEEKAIQLAEGAVMKRLYPGIVYPNSFEKELNILYHSDD